MNDIKIEISFLQKNVHSKDPGFRYIKYRYYIMIVKTLKKMYFTLTKVEEIMIFIISLSLLEYFHSYDFDSRLRSIIDAIF